MRFEIASPRNFGARNDGVDEIASSVKGGLAMTKERRLAMTGDMKILHLISSSGFFGAENVALNLMNSLKENSFAPYLVCLKNSNKPDPEIHSQAKKQGISTDVISCRNRFDIGAIGKIRKFIGREGIQLVHSHGYKSDLYGLFASKLSKVPIVATLHGWTGEDRKVRFYEFLDRRVVKRMNHLVSVSPVINGELERMGVNSSKVSFIPNAVDTEKFNPAGVAPDLRREFGLKETLVIGTVGRLSFEKGQAGLIRAFKEVKLVAPNAKLLIAGEGNLRKDLEKEAKDLGIEKDVIFAGGRKDMVSVYKTMDVFVLPSLTEGLPMVLLEAMSMALPVIATNVGAVSYVVNRGEGMLVPPGNIEKLRSAILPLLKDSNLRRGMGKEARRKVLSHFSLRRFYKGYKKVYNRLLSGEIASSPAKEKAGLLAMTEEGATAPMTGGYHDED